MNSYYSRIYTLTSNSNTYYSYVLNIHMLYYTSLAKLNNIYNISHNILPQYLWGFFHNSPTFHLRSNTVTSLTHCIYQPTQPFIEIFTLHLRPNTLAALKQCTYQPSQTTIFMLCLRSHAAPVPTSQLAHNQLDPTPTPFLNSVCHLQLARWPCANPLSPFIYLPTQPHAHVLHHT